MFLKSCIIAGIILNAFCFGTTATELTLARQLTDEADWDACILECKRVELHHASIKNAAMQLRQNAELKAGKALQPKAWWKRLGSLPVVATVMFYRVTISSALGSRCSLSPSCSAYSLQAARERGWLGLPMTGDRLIREPSVVAKKTKVVTNSMGRILYADPVSDHVGHSRQRNPTKMNTCTHE